MIIGSATYIPLIKLIVSPVLAALVRVARMVLQGVVIDIQSLLSSPLGATYQVVAALASATCSSIKKSETNNAFHKRGNFSIFYSEFVFQWCWFWLEEALRSCLQGLASTYNPYIIYGCSQKRASSS